MPASRYDTALLDHALSLDLKPAEFALYLAFLERERETFIASRATLAAELGSRWRSKSAAAVETVGDAARALVVAGLVERERTPNRETGATDGPETPYTYCLAPVAGAPAPQWDGARATVRAMVRRLPEVGPTALTAGARLAYAATSGGSLSATQADLARITGLDRKTALKAVEVLRSRSIGIVSCVASPGRPMVYELRLAVSDEAGDDGSIVPSTAPVREAVGAPRVVGGEGETHHELKEALAQVWHRDLLERVISAVERPLPAGQRLSPQERMSRYVRPLLEFQAEWAGHPPFVRYLLEEAIKSAPTHLGRWGKTVEKNNGHRFRKAAYATNGDVAKAQSPQALEEEVRSVLRECQALTGAPVEERDLEGAKRLWKERLTPDVRRRVAETWFDGDDRRANAMLLLALKFGVTDFRSIDPLADDLGLDCLPEWAWPTDLEPHRAWEARRERESRDASERQYGLGPVPIVDVPAEDIPWDVIVGGAAACHSDVSPAAHSEDDVAGDGRTRDAQKLLSA